MSKEIQIMCIYRSDVGREVEYYYLSNKTELMDEADYLPAKFWQTMGGISIIINKYNTIFSSTDFYNIVKINTFLLHTLYWLKEKESSWFDVDDDYNNDVVVYTGTNDLLKLSEKNQDELVLSFTPVKDKQATDRTDRYFSNETFTKEAWYNAAHLALSEYFSILQEVVKRDPSHPSSKIMLEYYNVWSSLPKSW